MRIRSHLHSGSRGRARAEHTTPDAPLSPDGCRGQYLCEVCEAAMTDEIVSPPESPSGLELAMCRVCRAQGQDYSWQD
jgi:hypothetical protein